MQQLVRRDYIHTLECFSRWLFASSKLCGWRLNVVRGKGCAASLKMLSNNLDATLTAEGGGTELYAFAYLYCFCPNFLTINGGAAFLPTLKEVGFHAVGFYEGS